MEHTYFMPGKSWQAQGMYYDETEKEYILNGVVKVEKEIDWTLKGFMEVLFDSPVRFMNGYNIKNTPNKNLLTWESYNPALGVLKGTFHFVGKYIVSFYVSQDGVYSGTETLIYVDESTYENVGISYKDGVKMSSWTAEIKEVK